MSKNILKDEEAVAIAMDKYYDLEQRLKRGLAIRPRLSNTSQRVRYLYQCSPDRSYSL